LFIFEQRYRDMLEHALNSHRMFCIGSRVSCDSDEVMPVTTAGVVHTCVKHEDGTSHLILMGLRRVRFTGWSQKHPFRIAKIEPLTSAPAPKPVLEQLRTDALNLLPPCPSESADAIQTLSRQLRQCVDPELVCDILTYHFVNHASILGRTLAERCVVKRYQMLIEALKDQQP
jgi:ATP-dependent Lon protease